MRNPLVKKEDLSFIDKLKSFLKNIFGKKNAKNECKETQIIDLKEEEKYCFEENLKAEVSEDFRKEYDLNKFIKKIETNPEILDKLSDNRLDKLIAYYEKTIAEKKEKIKKLKANQ